MKAEIYNLFRKKRKELIQAPTCSAEARKAAEQWLALGGAEREAEETKHISQSWREDIVTVDGLITLRNLKRGQRCFGADHAKEVAAHARGAQSGRSGIL